MPCESEHRVQDSEECNASDLWDEVADRLAGDASVTFEDYVPCDDEPCTSAEVTIGKNVNIIRCDEGHSDEGKE